MGVHVIGDQFGQVVAALCGRLLLHARQRKDAALGLVVGYLSLGVVLHDLNDIGPSGPVLQYRPVPRDGTGGPADRLFRRDMAAQLLEEVGERYGREDQLLGGGLPDAERRHQTPGPRQRGLLEVQVSGHVPDAELTQVRLADVAVVLFRLLLPGG